MRAKPPPLPPVPCRHPPPPYPRWLGTSPASCRHPESNPEGWIPLVVAENKLMGAPVLEKLAAVTDFPPAVMNYGR